MACGYGPDCPKCGQSAEWTESEIQEAVYAPKTYCCSHCYEFYMLTVDEIEALQRAAKKTLGSFTSERESEDDWKQARQKWDNPSED